MANYTQWRAAADKGETRRVTWVCGDQPVLIEEIIDTTRVALGAAEVNYASYTGGVDPDREIWAAANQYPLDPAARRLVLVRRAQTLTRWEPLTRWLAGSRQLTNSYLLFVADEDDFGYRWVEGKRAGLVPHLELIKSRGRIVRCAVPNEADALTWVRRRAGCLDEELARYLLRRTGADLVVAGAVCAKLGVLDGTPGRATINALCDETPSQSFVDSLLTLDKTAALSCGAQLTDRELTRTLTLLDTRLDLLAALWQANRAGLAARDILGHPPFLVREYLPLARDYDPARCVYRRRVLAVCEEAARSGARVGVVEALIALW